MTVPIYVQIVHIHFSAYWMLIMYPKEVIIMLSAIIISGWLLVLCNNYISKIGSEWPNHASVCKREEERRRSNNGIFFFSAFLLGWSALGLVVFLFLRRFMDNRSYQYIDMPKVLVLHTQVSQTHDSRNSNQQIWVTKSFSRPNVGLCPLLPFFNSNTSCSIFEHKYKLLWVP